MSTQKPNQATPQSISKRQLDEKMSKIPPIPPLNPAQIAILTALDPLVNQLIDQEIRQALNKEQRYLKSGQEKLKLEREKEEHKQKKRADFKQFMSEMTFYMNFYFIIFLLMSVSGVIGVVIGVNLPEKAICDGFCSIVRLRDR